MPQKPLKPKGGKIEKKKEAANRHGKTSLTRKGRFDKPPKKAKELEAYVEAKDVTRAINKRNEGDFAGRAETAGGKLKLIKAPPVLAPKDKQKKGKTAPTAKVDDMEDD